MDDDMLQASVLIPSMDLLEDEPSAFSSYKKEIDKWTGS